VATKVLTADQGIVIAAVFELLGALAGTAVATTIGKGLVDTNYVTMATIMCGLLAGITWNLVTWWLGCLRAPVTRSWVALRRGLGLRGQQLAVIKLEGIAHKVIIPMINSPICGFFIAFGIMGFPPLGAAHMASPDGQPHLRQGADWERGVHGFSHGMNDAQKTMGIIALTLFTATSAGTFEQLPAALRFLHTPVFEVALWIKVACALTMACVRRWAGRRIMKTLGRPNGEDATNSRLCGSDHRRGGHFRSQPAGHADFDDAHHHHFHHGCRRDQAVDAVKWTVVGKIVVAWVFTLPISGVIAYLLMELMKGIGSR